MTSSSPYISEVEDNQENMWFLVQYDVGPHIIVRRMACSDELVWNADTEAATQSRQRECVLVQTKKGLSLALVLFKSKIQQDIINLQNIAQISCMQLLHAHDDLHEIVGQLHFNHNEWLLIMYSPTVREDNITYGVFNRNDVQLFWDEVFDKIVAFVQEGDATYKGFILKVSNDITDILYMLNIIRNDMFQMFQEVSTIEQQMADQELHEEINETEEEISREIRLISDAFGTVDDSKLALLQRLAYLDHILKTHNIDQ